MKNFGVSLALVTLAVSSSASSQVVTASQPMVIGSPVSASVLRIGTDVQLRTVAELTTQGKQLKPGDRFDLEVSEPVTMAGQTVIPVGARAVGEITAIRNKGMWGKSGNIDARVLYVVANDRQIRLSGTVNDKGKAGGVGAAAVSAVVFLPAGFFMTGTSARLPAGTQVHARTDEDVQIAFAAPVSAATMPVSTASTRAPAAAPDPYGMAKVVTTQP